MIVVSGTFDFDFLPGGRDRALSEIAKVEAATRQEAGCLSYQFYADRDDESRFRVFEEWESPEALSGHMSATHVAEYRAALTEMGTVDRRVKAYEVSDVRDL